MQNDTPCGKLWPRYYAVNGRHKVTKAKVLKLDTSRILKVSCNLGLSFTQLY